MTSSLARLGLAVALCLGACAPGVLDDSGDLRSSDDALQKELGWGDSDAEFHVPGECPHAETLPASAQQLVRNGEHANTCTGCAGGTQCRICHTSDPGTGVVLMRTLADAKHNNPQGNCEQCHTSGAAAVNVSLRALPTKGSDEGTCEKCHINGQRTLD